MTQQLKEKGIAAFLAIVFHGILVILFLFITLSVTKTKPAEELMGIPVMFGNVDDAFGNNEPLGQGTTTGKGVENTAKIEMENPLPLEKSKAEKASKPIENSKETLATQNQEQTIAVQEAEKKINAQKVKEAEEQKQIAEKERLARQEAERKAKINQQMAGLFGDGEKGVQGSRGETHGTGTQGVQTGNASYGATSGIGGWGSFKLDGRSLGKGGLIKPAYNVNDYGIVVVDIIVDPKGNVVEAVIGRGGNTTSTVLKNEALKAAKKTKFNETDKVINQRGSITYKFELE